MEQLLVAKRVSLTRREGQLVSLIAQGIKNKELAYALGITEGTVKVYLSRIFKKLGVNDRFELALYAIKNVVSSQNGGADLAHVPHQQDDAEPDILRLHSFLLPPSPGRNPYERILDRKLSFDAAPGTSARIGWGGNLALREPAQNLRQIPHLASRSL
jgi:DNA-binding CsgD family transcriptional regulator